jgi:hypothetical protein
MTTISIADGFGLNVQAVLDPKSAFAKYFQKLPSFSVLQQDLASLQDTPLTEFPLKSTEVGLAFTQPTSMTTTCPQFGGSAGVAATLCVVKGGNLFDPDPFDNPIEVPDGRAYLGLGIEINVAPEVDIPSGKLTVGFAAESTLCLSHYQPFATTTTTPTFKAALQASLQNYVIPLSPDDLALLGIGGVAIIEGTGSLQLSGTVNLLTSVNPLVSLSAAPLPTKFQIQEGAEVAVTASCTITGDFQIRALKIDAGTVRLGFYRRRGAEFDVQVESAIGVTAGTSSTDYISAVLGAVSPSPFPSADDLKNAGLSDEKQAAIVGALKAAIQRRLELSILEELHTDSSQEAAFLYEISLNDLAPDGRAAIQEALKLNLSSLWKSSASLPRGIREIKNILTTTKTKGHSLKINILGLYNYSSISDLTLQGTVLTDPASGEIVITDSATATRISGSINFLADSDKLRKALAQSFLITAAYRCSGLVAHAPSLKVSYWHFAEHAKTDHSTMAANLNVLRSMGLVSAAQVQQDLTPPGDFGRSTFHLNTDYDDGLSQSLFLGGDGQPRAIEEFERIGRNALRQLIQPGGDDAFRLRGLDDAVWPQMKATGSTVVNLAPIFPDLRQDSQIPIIAGNYVLIEWWATTMARMAQSLSAAKSFFSQTPPPAPSGAAFQKVQADLWKQMADVARNTHDRFSDPWGMLAMDLSSGQQSVASAQIVSPSLTLRVERTPAP